MKLALLGGVALIPIQITHTQIHVLTHTSTQTYTVSYTQTTHTDYFNNEEEDEQLRVTLVCTSVGDGQWRACSAVLTPFLSSPHSFPLSSPHSSPHSSSCPSFLPSLSQYVHATGYEYLPERYFDFWARELSDSYTAATLAHATSLIIFFTPSSLH